MRRRPSIHNVGPKRNAAAASATTPSVAISVHLPIEPPRGLLDGGAGVGGDDSRFFRGRRFRFAFNDLLLMRMAKELLPRHRHVGLFQRCFDRVVGIAPKPGASAFPNATGPNSIG